MNDTIDVTELINRIRKLHALEDERYAAAIQAADYLAMNSATAKRLAYMRVFDTIMDMWAEESDD